MSEKKYYGVYQAIVTNIKDPEKRGRIKVKCPSVLGGSVESAWCDPIVTVAYDNGGDFCIPTKNEAVWVQFIEGDANRPVYLGGWWQQNMTPLGSNYSKVDKAKEDVSKKLTEFLPEGVEVKIVNVLPFGAFAEIINDVDGLIHVSQIPAKKDENINCSTNI